VVNTRNAKMLYVRMEKYAAMMTTTKSMAPIARRKNSNDGSGIMLLPFLFACTMGSQRRPNRFVPEK
jgi:hypothetical protein